MHPIRICLFFTYGTSLRNWNESGLLDREVSLYNKLAESGLEVVLFTYGDQSDRDYQSKVPTIRILPAYAQRRRPTNKILALLDSLSLPWRHRRELQASNIYKTNQMWGSWVALIAAFLWRKPLIVRCGYEHYQFAQLQGKPAWKRALLFLLSQLSYTYAARIIITSSDIRDFVAKHFQVPKEKITVLPNFINTEAFSPLCPPNAYEKRLLFIGRLSLQKNLTALIEAAHAANVGLDVVGKGELQESLETKARQLNADVRFLGVVPNQQLPQLICQYPVFILPSHYEGNPKTLLEAMSCGRAVVGANVPGIQNVIEDGKSGILCGTTAKEIAAAIGLILNDEGLRQRLGSEARSYIERSVSLNVIAQAEQAEYKKILSLIP